MSAKKQGPPRILQPVDTGRKSGWSAIYRPAAWFFHAGRLYVGYGRLSTFHSDEEPMWDPETVPVGAVVETCSGEYRFKKILEEGPPYFRKYAVLSFRYYHYPDDFGWGFLKKKIDQGKLLIEEQLVIPPDYYVTHQWGAGSGPSFFCGSFTCEEEAAYQRKRRRIYREGKKKKLSWDEIEKLIPRRTHQAFSSIGSVGSLTHKWGGGDGRSSDRNLERKILRASSLESMRFGKEIEIFRHKEHPHGCLRCGER